MIKEGTPEKDVPPRGGEPRPGESLLQSPRGGRCSLVGWGFNIRLKGEKILKKASSSKEKAIEGGKIKANYLRRKGRSRVRSFVSKGVVQIPITKTMKSGN